MRFSTTGYRPRFEVLSVLDYFVVRDNHALPVRLHADGHMYDRNTRIQPHSEHYSDQRDAQAVADWLADRAAGYPYNMLMAKWPRSLALSDREGAMWDARTVRTDWSWGAGSSGQTD